MNPEANTFVGNSVRAHHIDARRYPETFSFEVTDKNGHIRHVSAGDVFAESEIFADDLRALLTEHAAAELNFVWAEKHGSENDKAEAARRNTTAHNELPWVASEH